jgi:alpha-L-rhamnosidase
MNGISSYSMWWILLHRDWYKYQGDLNYLRQQQTYLKELLTLLMTKIDVNGAETLDGVRFLDWPSSENKPAIHAGLQAMMIMSLTAGAELSTLLGDPITARKCSDAVSRLKRTIPSANNSKQAASLLTLAGVLAAQQANQEVISAGGVKNYSTFYGYYLLQAKAKAGDYQGAIDNIRDYWGAMLDLGATTFWEDFNMDWLPNASRIDELVPEGKKDIHGDYGAYCYKGFRHSLCHGWASGPTAWLTEHVLGVHVTAAGSREITLIPHLGDLSHVEGTFPTPYGVVWIKHTKLASGQIKTEFKAPSQIRIKK